MLDLTKIGNVEKSIERHKKKCLGRIPKNLNDLRESFNDEHWKQLLQIEEGDPFIVDFVVKNNDTRAVIFMDSNLMNKMKRELNEQITLFVDGTFATVPYIKNNNCQLWTIVIRCNNRVSSKQFINFCNK